MTNAISKAIEGNTVKNGSSILYCNIFGTGQILSGASISYEDFDARLENRIVNQPGYYIYPQTRSITCTVGKGATWAGISIPLFQVPKDYAIKLTRMDAVVLGSSTPTLTFNIEERAFDSINDVGTDILTIDPIADADGLSVVVFDNEVISANSYLVLVPTGETPESGTVDSITITLYFDRVV